MPITSTGSLSHIHTTVESLSPPVVVSVTRRYFSKRLVRFRMSIQESNQKYVGIITRSFYRKENN